MADKAPVKSSDDGHTIAFKLAGLILFLLVLFSGLQKGSIFGPTIDRVTNNETVIYNEEGLIESKFDLSETVANKTKSIIRSSPGGQIIGLQKGGAKGKIIEGPMLAFDKIWWRVDYEKTPDGWIQEDDISKSLFLYSALNFFPNIYNYLKAVMILIGIIIFILVLIYSQKRVEVTQIKKQKREILKPAVYKNQSVSESNLKIQEDVGLPIPNLPIAEDPTLLGLKFETQENKRWKNIEYLISSHNSNDWRQAIIEADVILDEMLERMGYEGDSIGERLKQVEQSDFVTLNYAWEAHKVRNRIAHAGSAFQMSKDEAERIIDLYRKVFEEFYYI